LAPTVIVLAEDIMSSRIGATLVALAVCACTATESHAQAPDQAKDSAPRFSIFSGRMLDGSSGRGRGGLHDLEFGGSADFRLSALPVPLRATLAFREEGGQPQVLSAIKYGRFSLDVVGKPIPRIFGVQPYLLGGLGVATRAEYQTANYQVGQDGQITYSGFRTIPRNSWAFAEGGIGLEFGRHLFVQTKAMVPVASQGQILVPLSVGFRFWD
jgi:hypothetical protein